MNKQIIKSYIEEYKREFEKVHDQEIYKWHAVKQFQDNFDIGSTDFYKNLQKSLEKTNNLLSSGNYFAKSMLLENAEVSPEEIREMFLFLYDEDFNFLERIENYRSDFEKLSKKNFPDKPNIYQDHRAVMVYLTLMYPERFFFYKYQMFKDFSLKVEYPYKPVAGRNENLGQFHNLCELVRYEIEKDQELLKLHESRLDENCYTDKNHNVLTQDFIYAVVRHLNTSENLQTVIPLIKDVEEIISNDISVEEVGVDFKPRIINHHHNNIENKRLGDLGELWVLKQEEEYLKENGKEKLSGRIRHISKSDGDGAGFDILSYDLKGNKKYIEVKTTKGKKNSAFYVTRNELEKSKIEQGNYFLYRVYEYDEDTETAKLMKIQGDLTEICEIPVNYLVKLKEI